MGNYFLSLWVRSSSCPNTQAKATHLLKDLNLAQSSDYLGINLKKYPEGGDSG